ncbi:MAG: DUF4430 domain-containing protein [Candidatus Doudnabacteria bacterium]|nr:DUF4430 domain-containing protein [Candidatus Doudnabacteria bacterium]
MKPGPLKILFIVLAVVFLGAGCNQKPPASNQQLSTTKPPQGQIQEDPITITVEQTVEGSSTNSGAVTAVEGANALVLLKMYHKVETKTFSGIGEYVLSIDGKKENPGKNFWALYINGTQSQVGASDYKPKGGDKIIWKLEAIK